MTAAYRLKGIGWCMALAAIVLGFYLVSLRVAAERKALESVNARIAAAQRDIRALETEFDTRANLAQLEKWNGDTLALAAPGTAQFVRDDAQLAAIDPNAPAGSAQPGVRTAALVVPSLTETQPATATPAPAPVAPVQVAAAAPPFVQAAVFEPVAPTGRAASALARLAEAARGQAAVARVRPQAVAMLDRKLLSDTTFGDLMARARTEARAR